MTEELTNSDLRKIGQLKRCVYTTLRSQISRLVQEFTLSEVLSQLQQEVESQARTETNPEIKATWEQLYESLVPCLELSLKVAQQSEDFHHWH